MTLGLFLYNQIFKAKHNWRLTYCTNLRFNFYRTRPKFLTLVDHSILYSICFICILIRVFCPRAGLSLQTQEPRLQFYRRQVCHRNLRNQGCSFTRNWIGAAPSPCFPHPTLSLVSEQTLKHLKRSQGNQRGGEESGFGYLGPPDFTEIHHRG